MDDQGDLYFSFDDEEQDTGSTPYDTGLSSPDSPKPKTPRNRTFLVAVIALALISLLGIGLLAAVYLANNGIGGRVSENELTNQANMTLFASTQTAEYENQLAATEIFVPEEEGEGEAEAEPTEATSDETPASDGTSQPENEDTSVTQVAQAPTGAPTNTPSGSSIIIQVTPLGGNDPTESAATMAAATLAIGTPIVSGDSLPTLQPVSTLPQTGLFDTGNFGGIALLAVSLIGIIIIARRLRTK